MTTQPKRKPCCPGENEDEYADEELQKNKECYEALIDGGVDIHQLTSHFWSMGNDDRHKEALDILLKKPTPPSNGKEVLCVINPEDPCDIEKCPTCADDPTQCPNKFWGIDFVGLYKLACQSGVISASPDFHLETGGADSMALVWDPTLEWEWTGAPDKHPNYDKFPETLKVAIAKCEPFELPPVVGGICLGDPTGGGTEVPNKCIELNACDPDGNPLVGIKDLVTGEVFWCTTTGESYDGLVVACEDAPDPGGDSTIEITDNGIEGDSYCFTVTTRTVTPGPPPGLSLVAKKICIPLGLTKAEVEACIPEDIDSNLVFPNGAPVPKSGNDWIICPKPVPEGGGVFPLDSNGAPIIPTAPDTTIEITDFAVTNVTLNPDGSSTVTMTITEEDDGDGNPPTHTIDFTIPDTDTVRTDAEIKAIALNCILENGGTGGTPISISKKLKHAELVIGEGETAITCDLPITCTVHYDTGDVLAYDVTYLDPDGNQVVISAGDPIPPGVQVIVEEYPDGTPYFDAAGDKHVTVVPCSQEALLGHRITGYDEDECTSTIERVRLPKDEVVLTEDSIVCNPDGSVTAGNHRLAPRMEVVQINGMTNVLIDENTPAASSITDESVDILMGASTITVPCDTQLLISDWYQLTPGPGAGTFTAPNAGTGCYAGMTAVSIDNGTHASMGGIDYGCTYEAGGDTSFAHNRRLNITKGTHTIEFWYRPRNNTLEPGQTLLINQNRLNTQVVLFCCDPAEGA